MMKHLLARQIEEMKSGQEEVEADINAEAEARHQFTDDIKGHIEALLEGLRSCAKRQLFAT
jgi:hypothetical protein